MGGNRDTGPLLIKLPRRAESTELHPAEPRTAPHDRTGDPVLALKILPPRPRKNVLSRPRLDRPVMRQADVPIAIVEAPTGYGKTLLLAQWRRAAMAEGAAGAWLKLDEQDDARRLLHGVAMSMRQATGRPGFAASVEAWQPDPDWPLNAAAGLLAEWSRLAHPVVLILDDFERLTNPDARAVAHYLIANLPPNGRIFIGARAISDRAWLMEQQAYGRLVLIGRSELAFTLEESLAFLKERLPSGLSSNVAAQLHERTGGWPVGLELFVATLDRAREKPSVLSLIQTGSRRYAGTIIDEGFRSVARYVVKGAIAARPAVMEKFLIEISILDRLNAQLCTEVTRRSDAGELIAQLRQTTPLVVDREDGWFELHHIAAAHLREQAAALPQRRRRSLHARAASWLMRHQCWEEATRHAFEAGNQVAALDCIEKCAGTLLASGNLELLDSWFGRLPGEEVRKRPLLRQVLAFSMAIKCVPEHAALVADLAASAEPQQRFTAAVIRALGAMHVDDPDRGAAILAEWREQPCSDDPVLLRTYYNVRRWLDGLDGRPRKYRQWGEGASPVLGPAAFAGAETLHAHAVNYLNNGQPLLASRLLVPALARFEETFGRRSTPAVITAITLAAVANELDDVSQLRTLMADRLDRVDPPLLPELMSMGYIAMANLALSEGQTNQALDQLEFLFERTQANGFLRIQAIAAVELIKFHTAAGRIEPCQRALRELESIAGRLQARESLYARPVLLLLHLGRARASWAEKDAQTACASCESAIEAARSMRHRRLEFEARLLRSAILYDRTGEICPDLREVACLARDLRLNRMIREASQFLDPALLRAIQVPAEAEPRTSPRGRGQDNRRARASWDASAMMTAREYEVLRLLSRGMSNKEIAIALDIGAGTIKWHLKNLFLKVQATDRKQAVARARLLGLID